MPTVRGLLTPAGFDGVYSQGAAIFSLFNESCAIYFTCRDVRGSGIYYHVDYKKFTKGGFFNGVFAHDKVINFTTGYVYTCNGSLSGIYITIRKCFARTVHTFKVTRSKITVVKPPTYKIEYQYKYISTIGEQFMEGSPLVPEISKCRLFDTFLDCIWLKFAGVYETLNPAKS